MKDSYKSIEGSANTFFLGTLFSRFGGVFRDVFLAYFFGSTPLLASFMVAFRFSYLFRRLFGETVLSSSFIPYFENFRKKNEKEAAKFYRDIFFTLIFFLTGFIFFISLIFNSFSKDLFSRDFFDIFSLSLIMLPGLIFICLFSLNVAFLQCYKKFFITGIAPLFFNIFWILSIFLFKDFDRDIAIKILAIGVVFAYFFQMLFLQFSVFKFLKKALSLKEFFNPKIFSEKFKQIIKPISLTIIGVSAVQVNNALDSCFAKIADPSGPAYLWYAIRGQQVPIALFAIAISSALLPSLSREENFSKFLNFIKKSLEKTFALMILSTFFLLAIGFAAITIIYGRGSFLDLSIINTTKCLASYAIGIVFISFVFIFANAFFAKKMYLYPTIASVLSVMINIFLNAFFVFYLKWGAISVAIATSISAFFNFLILYRKFSKKFEKILNLNLLKNFAKNLTIAFLAFVITLIFGFFAFKDPSLIIFKIFRNFIFIIICKGIV